MILSAGEIKNIRGSVWTTEFEPDDVEEVFRECGPMQSIFYMTQFNLAWFVEKIFNNHQGKPLKLEAFQQVMLDMCWYKKFPMILATRGAGSSPMTYVYLGSPYNSTYTG